MRNSPYGITVPFRANATINKFRILTGRLPDFESGGGGSNPPSRTWTELVLSEPGTIRCRDNSVSGTIRDNSVSVHHYCFPCIKSVSWIHGKTSKTDRR